MLSPAQELPLVGSVGTVLADLRGTNQIAFDCAIGTLLD